MMGTLRRLCLLIAIFETAQLSAAQDQTGNTLPRNQPFSRIDNFNPLMLRENVRIQRQQSNSTTSTTPKPKIHRPSNIFSLISVLVDETKQDTNRALNEIRDLFNAQFDSNNSTTTTSTTTTTASPSSNATATQETKADGDDEDDETTEPYRPTRNEIAGVLRSNLKGLAKLFGQEIRLAIRDSNNNVKEFSRDLKKAFRPYFT